jgi:E3 ubiquitin-protein ligase MARCH6
LTALLNGTSVPERSTADATFHILQGYALGLVYARIGMRLIVTAPASRAAEAFRRITADGYFNPKMWLATRFFVLPASILSISILTFPPVLAKAAIAGLQYLNANILANEAVQVRLYRYSYPLAAGAVVAILGAAEIAKATSRWRARIRDEVYLVGERLHNFGEKRPPPGTRSVVRKER